MCTFVTMPLSYVVAVTKKNQNHWWGHRPSNICLAVYCIVSNRPKVRLKTDSLSLTMCCCLQSIIFGCLCKKIGCVEEESHIVAELLGILRHKSEWFLSCLVNSYYFWHSSKYLTSISVPSTIEKNIKWVFIATSKFIINKMVMIWSAR